MVLADEDIAKFQALYKSHFGKEISREDAYDKGIKLLRLMSIVYTPMTHKEYEQISKDQQQLINNIKQDEPN